MLDTEQGCETTTKRNRRPLRCLSSWRKFDHSVSEEHDSLDARRLLLWSLYPLVRQGWRSVKVSLILGFRNSKPFRPSNIRERPMTWRQDCSSSALPWLSRLAQHWLEEQQWFGRIGLASVLYPCCQVDTNWYQLVCHQRSPAWRWCVVCPSHYDADQREYRLLEVFVGRIQRCRRWPKCRSMTLGLSDLEVMSILGTPWQISPTCLQAINCRPCSFLWLILSA